MGPRVIYVHGNGNKIRRELLKRQWDLALFGGDMGGTTRMAYWAPLRHPSPLPDRAVDPLDGGADAFDGLAETPQPLPQDVEPPQEFVARTLGETPYASGGIGQELPGAGGPDDPLGDWLSEMTYFGDLLAESEAGTGVDTGTGGGPRTGGGTRNGRDGTAGHGPADGDFATEPLPEVLPLPPVARKALFRALVRHTFKDVHAYFFTGAGQPIRDLVTAEIEEARGASLIVVGHSLGSIVAYEVLRELERDVELFVTVGSPLAITEVQDHLARPPAVPPGVRAWRNVSDVRDLVALDHTLRPEYAPADRVTDLLVANTSRTHHGISQYLMNPQVSDACRELMDRLARA
ncbi:hypothetical protein [Streptomyces sp. SP18CS02]|uniref:hypothetical protein n=1 Tax=Streptomyces sp. SP18CS02 TaxID=3002531 RepID=UPI002E78AB4D|nr:hypothetical protein [Streptomyces sp. SP18CS02]MEE1757430.1 hypothetical protein [Streptomyces sp. SP18CS02]